MAGFQVANFDFGQNIENNRIRRQQMALQAAQANQQAALTARGQDIQRENAEASRDLERQKMDEASRQFDAGQEERAAQREEGARQFDAQQAQREKAFAADQKWKAWNADMSERVQALSERHSALEDALSQQKMDEADLRMQKFKKEMEAYDIAAENERVKSEELMAQAEERKNLFNSALGKGILAAFKNGGNLFGEQLQLFNNELAEISPDSQPYDFVGNTITDPKSGMRQTIGDGNTMYMGTFQRDKQGNIQYGNDGTPMLSMQAIPRGIVETVLNSAYGKSYLEVEKSGGRTRTSSGGTSSGTRGGLTAEQTMARDEAKYDNSARKDRMTFFEKFMNSAAGMQMMQNVKTPKDLALLYKDFESEFSKDQPQKTPSPISAGGVVDAVTKRAGANRKPGGSAVKPEAVDTAEKRKKISEEIRASNKPGKSAQQTGGGTETEEEKHRTQMEAQEKEDAFKEWYAKKKKLNGSRDMTEQAAREQFETYWKRKKTR